MSGEEMAGGIWGYISSLISGSVLKVTQAMTMLCRVLNLCQPHPRQVP